jgi:carbamoyltransferase
VPLFEELTDEFSREDIAAGVQQISEETITAVVADAIQMTGLKRVSLSGGVLSNVKVNQRIREMEVVEDVYVHPNMTDGGLAAGAALKAWAGDVSKSGEKPSPRYLKDVYLGPSFTNDDVERAIGKFSFKAEKSDNVEEKIAELLKNKTVSREPNSCPSHRAFSRNTAPSTTRDGIATRRRRVS